ncbi:hypothetical protein AKJ16_DCAP03426 [Drosera capensis]
MLHSVVEESLVLLQQLPIWVLSVCGYVAHHPLIPPIKKQQQPIWVFHWGSSISCPFGSTRVSSASRGWKRGVFGGIGEDI